MTENFDPAKLHGQGPPVSTPSRVEQPRRFLWTAVESYRVSVMTAPNAWKGGCPLGEERAKSEGYLSHLHVWLVRALR